MVVIATGKAIEVETRNTVSTIYRKHRHEKETHCKINF